MLLLMATFIGFYAGKGQIVIIKRMSKEEEERVKRENEELARKNEEMQENYNRINQYFQNQFVGGE